MISIDQVLVGAGRTDAITNMARAIRKGLGDSMSGDIFARHPALGVSDVLPLSRFGTSHVSGRIVVFHASIGDPDVFEALNHCEDPVVLVFHNIAPATSFESIDPERAASLHDGWRELELLRPKVAVVIADSAFNAACLSDMGYRDITVLPVGLDASRLNETAPDQQFLHRLTMEVAGDLLLSVGQMLPHKHPEVLVQMQYLLTEYCRRSTTLVIVGPPTIQAIADAVAEQAAVLNTPQCLLYGQVTDAELAALYSRADLFVSASTHEGLCIPAIEAMAAGVPVLARQVGAIPQTVGQGGILLPPDAGPELFAEAVIELLDNEPLRSRLTGLGLQEVRRFDAEQSVKSFLDLLDEAI
ncbi:MAG: glycosyltransferase family 4 protein [Acidimicrobiales bacterium]|nr:glycosyltransferase family 4 protein [Acidimicrobiales bacterium]